MPLLRKLSINLKLPLLVAALLLAVVTIFATLAYRQVAGAATAESADRLDKVGGKTTIDGSSTSAEISPKMLRFGLNLQWR